MKFDTSWRGMYEYGFRDNNYDTLSKSANEKISKKALRSPYSSRSARNINLCTYYDAVLPRMIARYYQYISFLFFGSKIFFGQKFTCLIIVSRHK